MNEAYRDEVRVEHMNRAIQKIQRHLLKVDAGNFVERESVGELAATIQPIKTLPPNVAEFD